MTNLKKVTTWYDELSEDVIAKNESYQIWSEEEEIGQALIIITEHDDREYVYLESIDIYPEFQNRGHGTEAIQKLSKIYGGIYFAPNNEDAQRLYERIATETTDEWKTMPDQGYGVYEI